MLNYTKHCQLYTLLFMVLNTTAGKAVKKFLLVDLQIFVLISFTEVRRTITWTCILVLLIGLGQH